MRHVRYNVAASLDGYIATADGGYDWIPNDPTVDFAALFAKVDTVLLGRHSYDLTLRNGDIWLFGGGKLFSNLLAAGQVDRVEVTVVPVLLGGRIPLSMPGTPQSRLQLTDTHRYPSGMVTLSYAVPAATG